MTVSECRKAQAALGQIVNLFRAASALEEVLKEVEKVVVEVTTYDEQAAAAQANAEAQNKYLADLKQEVAEKQIEKEKLDVAIAQIRAQLKSVGV